MSRIAVYPGSFDPITNGHVDIIRRSMRVFDRVIAAVAFNPNKDTSWFTPEERVEMIRETFRDHAARVEADKFSGLLVDYAVQKGASVIVRGLRAVADFEYEFQMTAMNQQLDREIETVFLMADPRHQAVASSLVKVIAQLGGDVSAFVSPRVKARLLGKTAR